MKEWFSWKEFKI